MSSIRSAVLVALSLMLLLGCDSTSSNPTRETTGTPVIVSTPVPTPSPTPFKYIPPPKGQIECVPTEEVDEKDIHYRRVVQQAIDKVISLHPYMFDYNIYGNGWIVATIPEKYIKLLVQYINDTGEYEAQFRVQEQPAIMIKQIDTFSEVYVIMTSFGGVRNLHSETCYPAEF
jgi:hypothetical protein